VRATFEAAAISELARRTLRSDEVSFKAGSMFSDDIGGLSTALSDSSPSLIIEVRYFEVESDTITIEFTELAGGRIGEEEPGDDLVWIPGDVHDIWSRYLRVMVELASAGYPGCVGCAGPAAEAPWDEALSRSRLT